MIVVDVETTGINPWKNAMVSIGAVNYKRPLQQFYRECRIFDGAEVDHAALAVNGFCEEEIRDPLRASLEETISEFAGWLQEQKQGVEQRVDILGGMNVGFDRFFLMTASERTGVILPISMRTYDLHTVCAVHSYRRAEHDLGRDWYTTTNILHYVGLPTEPSPHHALMGAKMEAEAFARLLEGRWLLEEFRRYEIPWNLQKKD